MVDQQAKPVAVNLGLSVCRCELESVTDRLYSRYRVDTDVTLIYQRYKINRMVGSHDEMLNSVQW